MKTTNSLAATAALLASASAQGFSSESFSHPTGSAITTPPFPTSTITYPLTTNTNTASVPAGFTSGDSCVASCFSNLYSTEPGTTWQTSVCSNSTALDSVNNCISSSSCSDSDREGTYQVLAQACADQGYTLSATQEATFSATSGGSAYPTNSQFASLASSFATMTGRPTDIPAFVSSINASHTGWSAGGGFGPFGSGSAGWGPWASRSTGSWTDGPWTSWWGEAACPPSTWSGWTSGSWSGSAPWTTWTGCAATTTATSVMTTTITSGSSSVVETTTSFGVKVAQATSSSSGSGSTTSSASGTATSAKSSGSAGEKRAVAGAGTGLVGLVAAILMI